MVNDFKLDIKEKKEEVEMEEIEKGIIKLVKEGYFLIEISQMLQKDYEKEILPINKNLKEQGFLTQEDIQKGKDERKRRLWRNNPLIQRIFEYKMKGISDHKISKMSDIKLAQVTVSGYIREGIRLGLIKKEDIEKAVNERKEEEKLSNLDRKRVLEGLTRGKLDTQIAKYTRVGDAQVKNIRLNLIQEGVITQEEIDEARQKAQKKRKQEKSIQEKQKVEIDMEKLLSYLILGYDTRTIKDKMKIFDLETYYEAVNKLIEEKKITDQEIKEYREIKEKQDKVKVLKGLKKGMPQRKIAKTIDQTLRRTQTYIKKIQQEENISDEDILCWKNEKETSVEKRKLVVLEGLIQGLTGNEIVEKYPEQELKTGDVKNYKTLLIAQGKITKNQIIQYRQIRKEKEKEKHKSDLTVFEEQIWGYLMNGYKAKEIANFTGKSISYICIVMKTVKQKKEISEKEIEQAIQQREEKKERQQYNLLKREIKEEVELNIELSQEKQEKIREYIDLCYETHKKQPISKSELLFLKQALQKVPITYKDMVKYTQMCLTIKAYTEAFSMVRSRNGIQQITIPKKQEAILQKLENYLRRACQLEQAIEIIKRGNTNTEILCKVTGLSKDEINILKIELSKEPIKLLNIVQREKVIELLLQDNKEEIIQRNLQMSDFEMQDIKQQVKFRRITPNKRDREAQIKQDSETRIVVLATKLGIKPGHIAKILKKESQEEVESTIRKATDVGLIKQNQWKGIQLLENSILTELELRQL